MKIHLPHNVNVVMGHTRMTTQGNTQFNQNNHPFLGHVDGNSFALAHNGVLWNDKVLRLDENLPQTSGETDSYVAVQLLEQQITLDFDSLKFMAEKVEGSFVFTVLDRDNSIRFVVGDNPLYIMFYDGFLIYASTQEILCKAIKKLRLKAPAYILEPKEGEILKIDRTGRITTGAFMPKTSFEQREIITDKESGKNLDCPGYQALKTAMRRTDAKRTLFYQTLYDILSRMPLYEINLP